MGAIEKSQIFLLQYWQKEQFENAPTLISHFVSITIIFADYMIQLVMKK